MTFEEYLNSKKIESAAFRLAQQSMYEAWQQEFEQVHPNSFTMQKLFVINKVRRQYPLKETVGSPAPSTPVAKPKPIMRPKIN